MPQAAPDISHHGSKRDAVIAVIDDDLAVRNSLAFSLGIEGFTVRAYATADELTGSAVAKPGRNKRL